MDSLIATSPSHHAGITRRTSARRVSAVSQRASADGSLRQVQASTLPESLIFGGTMSLKTSAAPASQPVNTSPDTSQSAIVVDSLSRTLPAGPVFNLSQCAVDISVPSQNYFTVDHDEPHVINSDNSEDEFGAKAGIKPSAFATQRASLLIPGTTKFPNNSLARTISFSQPVSFSTRSDSGPAESPSVIAAMFGIGRSPLAVTSSSCSTGTSTTQIIEGPMRFPLPNLDLTSSTIPVTSLEDVNDPNTRLQVSLLQQLHPWTSVTLCHSMLAGCRVFEDASKALQKYALKMSNFDDVSSTRDTSQSMSANHDSVDTTIHEIAMELMDDPTLRNKVAKMRATFRLKTALACVNALIQSRGDIDAAASILAGDPYPTSDVIKTRGLKASGADKPISNLNLFFSSQPSTTSTSRSSTVSSKKPGKRVQVARKVERAQHNISLFKLSQSARDIFSREQRQRDIASSVETAADRERASFVANAVLYRALSKQDSYGYGRVTKSYSARNGITSFPMTSGVFPRLAEKAVLSKHKYKGTDRGKFQPLSFETPDGKVALQSINLAYPYLKVSVEELRLGDYIRGRKKAPHLFDIFRKLPAEIRCMIWRFAMTPRTIELRYNYSLQKCWTLHKVPTLLHVGREARYEALKRYSLAFGIKDAPAKTYFDFKRDTLFLTYEKWYDDGEYDEEVEQLTYHFGRSEETTKIQSLAIDQEVLDIYASRLEDEEEDWLDIGDEEIPEPELDVLPEWKSLQSLAIVKTQIDGFWDHDAVGCGCDPDDDSCEIRKRMAENDKAVFVSVPSSTVANKTRHEFYNQLLAKVKDQNPKWSRPELSYMVKRSTERCRCGRFH